MKTLPLLLGGLLAAVTPPAAAKGLSCAEQATILSLQLQGRYSDGLPDRARALVASCPTDAASHRAYQLASTNPGHTAARLPAEYQDLRARHPGDPVYDELYAAALLRAGLSNDDGGRDEVLGILAPLAEAGRLSAYGYIDLMLVYRLKDDAEAANTHIAEAWRLDPTVTGGRYLRALLTTGRADDALAACQQALTAPRPHPAACAPLWGKDAELTETQTARRQKLGQQLAKLAPRRAREKDALLLWQLAAFTSGTSVESFGPAWTDLATGVEAHLAALYPTLTRQAPPAPDAEDPLVARLTAARQIVDMPARVAALEALATEAEGELLYGIRMQLYQAYTHPLVANEAAATRVLKQVLEANPASWSLLLEVGPSMIEAGELDTLQKIVDAGFQHLASDPFAFSPFSGQDPGVQILNHYWGVLTDLYQLRGLLHHARGEHDAAALDLLTAWQVQDLGFDGEEDLRSTIALRLGEVYDAAGDPERAFEAYLLAASGAGEDAKAAKEVLAPRVAAWYPSWSSVDAFVAAVGPTVRWDRSAPPAAAPAPEEGAHPLVGKAAPEVALTDLDGQPLNLSDLKGKVVFLTFWATWCGPCMQEMPIVAKLKAEWGDSVEVVALATWDEEPAVRTYVSGAQLPFRFALAPNTLIDTFDINGIPMSAIVDPQGIIRVVHLGYGEDLLTTLPLEIEAARAPLPTP